METILQVPDVISDNGFFNIGISLTTDDVGRGGTAPLINTLVTPAAPFPLSFSRLAKLQAQGHSFRTDGGGQVGRGDIHHARAVSV